MSPFGSLYRVFHCFYQALTVMLPAMTSSPRFAAVIFSASLVMASSSVLPVASYFFPLKRAVFSRISLAFSSYSGIIEGQLSRQTYCPSSRPWYCRTGGGVFYFSSVSTSSFRFNRRRGSGSFMDSQIRRLCWHIGKYGLFLLLSLLLHHTFQSPVSYIQSSLAQSGTYFELESARIAGSISRTRLQFF